MVSLEERIRPPLTAASWRRDVLGAGLIIALTAVLLGGWVPDQQRGSNEVIFSFYLLPALGMCLALRCGAIDLSVWGVSALGGAAAAWGIRNGVPVAAAILLGLLAGAMVGAAHGLLARRFRFPSALMTLITASIIVLCLRAVGGGDERTISVPTEQLAAWRGWAIIPRLGIALRKPPLFVALAYSVTLLSLIVVEWSVIRNRLRAASGVATFASLYASGALAGLGGALWLVDRGSTPIPAQLFGDLRVPAAAILAGAALFAGRGRTLLAVLCLPVTMLVATIWRQEVMHLPFRGYSFQMILLIGMTICTHLSILHAETVRSRTARSRTARLFGAVLANLSLAMTAGGMLVFATAVTYLSRSIFHLAGIGTWTIGCILLIVSRILSRRQTPEH